MTSTTTCSRLVSTFCTGMRRTTMNLLAGWEVNHGPLLKQRSKTTVGLQQPGNDSWSIRYRQDRVLRCDSPSSFWSGCHVVYFDGCQLDWCVWVWRCDDCFNHRASHRQSE